MCCFSSLGDWPKCWKATELALEVPLCVNSGSSICIPKTSSIGISSPTTSWLAAAKSRTFCTSLILASPRSIGTGWSSSLDQFVDVVLYKLLDMDTAAGKHRKTNPYLSGSWQGDPRAMRALGVNPHPYAPGRPMGPKSSHTPIRSDTCISTVPAPFGYVSSFEFVWHIFSDIFECVSTKWSQNWEICWKPTHILTDLPGQGFQMQPHSLQGIWAPGDVDTGKVPSSTDFFSFWLCL